ncbi:MULTISPECIES: T9SS type A sorting domain-containing protein [Flavobacterium]|uniref:T9SS type A sorting domain-containing protein n=1 Tax=Flavobacterium keumense TaxID=1306518 RepID=A0ABY8N6F5_9FLAO|nr:MULTISPECIES: T9SS type A sorting domain-containing protein [Flavobacterium]WGK94753.1 T9SS type A sorting domain-containing protein [Flavobacterium keumense]
MCRIIMFLFYIASHSQVLHHQVISSLGSSMQTSNGTYVSQTIGQFGVFASHTSSNYYVQQGFQQSLNWNNSKVLTLPNSLDNSITIMYPNPVETILNFEFTKYFNEVITLEIFDISGRVIYKGDKKIIGKLMSLDLSQILVSGKYIIKLSSSNFNYTNKLLKL